MKSLNDQLPGGFGTEDVHVTAIRYAVEQGADVINASWFVDPLGPDHLALAEAIQEALAAGVLVVAATGNEASDVLMINNYPAVLDGVMAVSASTERDLPAWQLTNFGPAIDVAAPGASTNSANAIISTCPANAGLLTAYPRLRVQSPAPGDPGPYLRLGGTSMASPHVSGTAALLLSQHPDWSPWQIRAAIRASADRDPVGDPRLERWLQSYVGYGRLNAEQAVRLGEPLVPRIVRAVPAEGRHPFVLDLVGSVEGAPSLTYELAIGRGLLPQAWTVLASGLGPADEQVLGTWDGRDNGGMHTARLTAQDASGVPFEDRRALFVGTTLVETTEPIRDPVAGYDGTWHVLAWMQEGRVFVTRVHPDGTLVDAQPIPVSPEGAQAQEPSMACGAGHCLVVWQHPEPGEEFLFDLSGALLDTTQREAVSAQPVDIAVVPELTQTDPRVAYNGTDYWVLWHDHRSSQGLFGLYGTRVSPHGVVANPGGFELYGRGSFLTAVACARSGSCVVVWPDQYTTSPFDQVRHVFRTLVLDSSGAVPTNPPAILAEVAAGKYHLVPSVASNGSTFLVVWDQVSISASSETRVYGMLVRENGIEPAGPIVWIDQRHPASGSRVWFDGRHYVVSWHKAYGSGGGVVMARVNSRGELVTPEPVLLGISHAFRYRGPQPTGAGTSGSSWFAWRHREGQADQLVGTVLGWPSTPPTLEPIPEQHVAEGALLTFTLAAHDADGDGLRFAAEPLPSGATLNPASGVFTWTPGYDQQGRYELTVTVTDDGGLSASQVVAIEVANVPLFVRGDANGDGELDVSDAVRILLVKFAAAGLTCGDPADPERTNDACDANDDGELDVSDAIFVLNHLFTGGPPPPPPFPAAGPDPTLDGLN